MRETVRVTLPAEALTSRDAFHDGCAAALGFPDFYGRKGDAWIDCMQDVDTQPATGMTHEHVAQGGVFVIEVTRMPEKDYALRHPMAQELIELAAIVNGHFEDAGSTTRMAIAFVEAQG